MKKILYSMLFLLTAFCYGCGDAAVVVEKNSNEEASLDSTQDEDADMTDITGSAYIISEEKRQFAVYVCGAVKKPDVYYVDEGSIISDVLALAGGFDEGACDWYVNLADYVRDGTKIYFPYESDIDNEKLTIDDFEQTKPSGEDALAKSVNINTATKEELMSLSGIGESRAEAIIKYRDEHGSFKDISEICNVSGIKEGLYNKIKDFITVD